MFQEKFLYLYSPKSSTKFPTNKLNKDLKKNLQKQYDFLFING